MAVLPAIDAACKEAGISARAATVSSTAPVLDWFYLSKLGLKEAAPEYNAAVFRFLCKQSAHHPPPTVVLAALWSQYFKSPSGGSFGQALRETIAQLRRHGMKVILFKEVPMFGFDPPRALTLASMLHSSTARLRTTVARHERRVAIQNQVFAELAADGVRLVDPLPVLARPDGIISPADDGGVIWRDSNHLSTYGARRLVPAFRDALAGETAGGSGQE